DGRPLAENWDRFADALFAKLDTDKDGSLAGGELARLPRMLALLSGRTGFPPATGPMSRAGLAHYLRRSDLGPFRVSGMDNRDQWRGRVVRAGSTVTTEELDKALLELLDADKDGKLSPAELAAAPAILAKLDADENELITTDELLRRPPALPFYVEEIDSRAAPGPGVELLLLSRGGSDPALARRLLARYGGKPGAGMNAPPKRRPTRAELGIGEEAVAALDQGGDGELDIEELARFGGSCVPEVEIALRLGTVPAGVRPAEVIAAGKSPVTAAAVGQGSEVALEVPGVRLDLNPGPAEVV